MSLLAPIRRRRVDQAASSGVLRSVRLFRLFLAEQADPEKFYTSLAEDAVRQVAEYGGLPGQTVVDVGGGGGWFTAAFRARGANLNQSAAVYAGHMDRLIWGTTIIGGVQAT
jgi:2-polyprenyl-3-methyl-5-hydroxy-6-metoxy-1,4-benzoquinol methylase